jgi:hypothetical protein
MQEPPGVLTFRIVEKRKRSKLSVERTDPFSCILVLLSLSDPASVYPVYLFA